MMAIFRTSSVGIGELRVTHPASTVSIALLENLIGLLLREVKNVVHNLGLRDLFRKSSLTVHLLPNWLDLVVSCSFVWEVKAGLTIKQLTKRNIWFRIWLILSTGPPLFFFLTISINLLHIWSPM
jgi:hypothetical protein